MEIKDKTVLVFNKEATVKDITVSQNELNAYDEMARLFYSGIGSNKDMLIEPTE